MPKVVQALIAVIPFSLTGFTIGRFVKNRGALYGALAVTVAALVFIFEEMVSQTGEGDVITSLGWLAVAVIASMCSFLGARIAKH